MGERQSRGEAYTTTTIFHPHGHLLAVCDELPRDCGHDIARRDVLQARAEAQGAALVGRYFRGVYFVPGQDELAV